MIWIGALTACMAMLALDFVWARYTRCIADGYRWQAANYAALIMLFNGIATLTYTNNAWLLFPAMVGAFLGTYIGTRSAR